MTDKQDSEPRNPTLFDLNGDLTTTTEVTLRDLFAAAALGGFCVATAPAIDAAKYAHVSYALADAMLAERERKEPGDE